MIYFTNLYAKMWSIDTSGKFPRGRITTSEKNLQDEWVNSSWFVSFMGNSKKAAMQLKGDERIKILKGKVVNPSKKMEDGTFKNYLGVSVFEFELMDSSRNNKEQEETVEDSDEPLPF